jgi:hypothetical protein
MHLFISDLGVAHAEPSYEPLIELFARPQRIERTGELGTMFDDLDALPTFEPMRRNTGDCTCHGCRIQGSFTKRGSYANGPARKPRSTKTERKARV